MKRVNCEKGYLQEKARNTEMLKCMWNNDLPDGWKEAMSFFFKRKMKQIRYSHVYINSNKKKALLTRHSSGRRKLIL